MNKDKLISTINDEMPYDFELEVLMEKLVFTLKKLKRDLNNLTPEIQSPMSR